ncbi:MAG TPA: hypothetical protein VK178_05170 [Opitutaceae bacterium]|nr:hypothetical protein [Opitutaceae bacterium]
MKVPTVMASAEKLERGTFAPALDPVKQRTPVRILITAAARRRDTENRFARAKVERRTGAGERQVWEHVDGTNWAELSL